MGFSIVTFLLIMAAMAFVDVCWTLYFINLVERRAHTAAFWSAMIIVITAFIVTIYIEDAIYIIAAFIGAYVGTFGTIVWKKKKEAKQNP